MSKEFNHEEMTFHLEWWNRGIEFFDKLEIKEREYYKARAALKSFDQGWIFAYFKWAGECAHEQGLRTDVGLSPEYCPYPEEDPCRKHWITGFKQAHHDAFGKPYPKQK